MPCSYFVGQVVLYTILDLEIAVFEYHRIRATLRPDISHAICTAEFQRNEVIQLAYLIVARIAPRPLYAVPGVRHVLLLLAGVAIADATSVPLRVTQGIQLHGGINPAGCATRIGNRVAPSRRRRTAVTRRFLPLASILRAACDSKISAGLIARPRPL